MVEQRLGTDFSVSAPPDPLLDHDGYFEQCWPGAESREPFEFVRLVEAGDEPIVTYQRMRADGGRGRNDQNVSRRYADGRATCNGTSGRGRRDSAPAAPRLPLLAEGVAQTAVVSGGFKTISGWRRTS